MSTTHKDEVDYPWTYSDVQGYNYPLLKVLRFTNPGFAMFVDPQGQVLVLDQSRITVREGDKVKVRAAEQLDRCILIKELEQKGLGTCDMYTDVVVFHCKHRLEYNGPPRSLPPALDCFREDFIEEEFYEFQGAETDAKKFDACMDMIYVILGYCYLRGWPVPEGWSRVQRANMDKVRAKGSEYESERSNEYDVVKPRGWTAPDLTDLVK